MNGYEAITNLEAAKAVRRAEECLRNGWSRRGYQSLDLHKPIPWELPSQTHRSWNFYVHALDMIDPLLAAHDQTGDRKYLEPALRIGLDWVETHPRDAEGVSPMAWYDMAVGLRAYRLGYLYQAAEAEGLLSEAQRSAFWASLDEHRTELADDATIAFHNNHGYFQVAGQLALGRRFRDVSPAMAELHAQGGERLHRMLTQQFTEEGVHREHSPDYHRMVVDTLLGLIRAGLVEDAELRARARAIEEALAWFVYPSGVIVNFGDSDSRAMTCSAPAAERKWTTPLMQAVASSGATGGARPEGLRAFPDSGYAVVRQPDPQAPEIPAQDSYLALAAAFHSRTHKHADDLNFVWYDHGQPILVDAGRYGYIGKTEQGSELWKDGHWYSDPMRIFMESTRAHNTLEFDGRDFPRKGGKPYGSALERTAENDGVFVVEARCKHFRSIWHDRVLMLRPGRWLIVFDVFKDNLDAVHDVRQWFHTAPGNVVLPDEGAGYRIHLADSGAQLCVRSLLPETGTTPVLSGQREGRLQGWWSGRERNAEPAPAFAFTRRASSGAAFATLFSFSSDCAPDLERSRTNTSGRKARLAWKDGSGRHEITFDRNDTLSVEVSEPDPERPGGQARVSGAEYGHLRAALSQAEVVLEYGAGSASILAAPMPGKFVMAVECDSDRARHLSNQIATMQPASTVLVHRADPVPEPVQSRQGSDAAWLRALAYPNSIREQSFFRDPDLVVIKGAASFLCTVAVLLSLRRPATILLLDYAPNTENRLLEHVLRPDAVTGAMAQFDACPGMIGDTQADFLLGQYFAMTKSGQGAAAQPDRTGAPTVTAAGDRGDS